MKENIFKGIVAVAVGGLSAYLGVLAIPLIILLSVMIIDYASGMLKAWISKSLCSRTGVVGIIKKVGYMLVVCVAAVVDWLVTCGFSQAGIDIEVSFCFGLIVTIWFIINELISILENLATIGVPLPSFLVKLIHKLKVTVDKKTEEE